MSYRQKKKQQKNICLKKYDILKNNFYAYRYYYNHKYVMFLKLEERDSALNNFTLVHFYSTVVCTLKYISSTAVYIYTYIYPEIAGLSPATVLLRNGCTNRGNINWAPLQIYVYVYIYIYVLVCTVVCLCVQL